MRVQKLIPLVMLTLISGLILISCATNQAPPNPDYCANAFPIYLDAEEAKHLTPRTKAALEKHFVTGKNLCGWGRADSVAMEGVINPTF